MKFLDMFKMVFKKAERKPVKKVSGKKALAKAAPRKSAKAEPVKARSRKAKVFDFFKVVSVDPTRLFMQGVFHENGFKIATNGRVMAMARAEYEPRFEGVILSKQLVPIEGQFPNYKKVIPDMTSYRKIDFDLAAIKAEIKAMSEIVKIAKAFDRDTPCRFKVTDGILINFIYLQRAVEFMEAYPGTELYICEEGKAVAFVCRGNGALENPDALFLVMPMADSDELAWKGSFGFHKGGATEYDVLVRCRKKDIAARREAGTLTEKDKRFLDAVRGYLAMFKAAKNKAA